ncbi:MAG: SDR family NAD(P)-dependent oxidoreductase [Calothrix sp. CSU_2_0]|nr:SDR family NAD(P)-dependent oxidoreductase [Calothrix sp. CSU_2_0]
MNNLNNMNTSERVLAALKDAREKLEAVELEKLEQVAIIGMAGRFPGACNIDEFWNNIKNGVECIEFLSDEELLAAGVTSEELENPNYVRAYASFPGIDEFDAAFFGYSPREAEILDPQHRVFLECAWSALENAGYDSQQYVGEIAVYGGAALNSYLVNFYSNSQYRNHTDPVQVVISNVMGLMPTRVSYKLNLTGASCGIQTGCSTSLVSVHLACQSLLNRECDMALAGGVSLGLAEKKGYLYKEDGVLSPDGYCRAFDVNGKGTVFGNGVGIVVLKRLRDAVADGDRIYAIIKGTAVNNDGSQKVGLTAPSVTGQAKVVSAALAKAKVKPDTIQYIEAHGTGTALGDPIEIAALTKAFSQHTNKTQFCAIGSVKTNIGHLDAAAGISGLIKVVLALKHGQIPPSLNFTAPNSQIDFDNSPFFVNTQLRKWDNSNFNVPKRAAISSFGMGGTNAHAILEEAPLIPPSSETIIDRGYHLIPLSAKTPSALETATANLRDFLKTSTENIADIAYTLQIGRRTFEHRRCLLCQTTSEAVEILTQPDSPQLFNQSSGNIQPSVVFLFPGQGSQYVNMGWELYKTESVFRSEIDSCCELLIPHLGLDLRNIIYPASISGDGTFHVSISDLSQTVYTQPALFIVEYALAKLWMSWGIQPRGMIGHSIGEYVAATLAGVFTLADALMVVAQRGKLMQKCPPGVMLSVSLSSAKLQPFLSNNLVISVENAPELCVVSGEENAIALLEQHLTNRNIVHRRLHTSHAFHSHLMQPAVIPLTEIIAKIQLNPPQIPIISNVTGTWLTPQQACDSKYWANHLLQPVKFAQGITQLQQIPQQVFLEVGFSQILSTLVRQFPDAPPIFPSGRHPKDTQSDVSLICKTLGKLWLAGIKVDWSKFHSQKRQRVPLPTYPFERQRYWIDLHPSSDMAAIPNEMPQKQEDISNWFYLPSWQQTPLLYPSEQPKKQRYLLFCHCSNFAKELQQHLQTTEQEVITVIPGDSFNQEGNNYAIALDNPDDYQRLWQQLQANNTIPDVIIYGLGFTESIHKSRNTNNLEIGNFASLMWIIQAFSPSSQPLRLCILTQQVQNVLGTENLNLRNSPILGLCKIIPQEYPHIYCQNIDLLPTFNNWEILVRELTTNFADINIAYRGKQRWKQEFEAIKLPESKACNLPVISGGVYVIAGDLVEGLGLIYARYLAEKFNAKLVLLGRKSLPLMPEWENWLATHGRHNPISYLIQQLQALRDRGCEFIFDSVDLANINQVKTAITTAIDKFGYINGVIHAASMGDSNSCLISNLTLAECERQFHSKINGLLNLEAALQHQKLDFFLLQSSLSSIIGGIGFAAYAGANIFMDTLAQQRSQNTNTPWISINWDAVTLDEIITPTGTALIDLAMTPSEIWEVSERILSQPLTGQIIVSPVELRSRFSTQSQLPEDKTFSSAISSHARPEIPTEYIAPRNEIETKITQVMENLLGISPIGINDNFFALGGHSLLAIQAVSQLRQEFQVELPMRQFLFESPTIAGIAKIVAENQTPENSEELADLLAQVEQMSPEEVEKLLAEN